ncbi:MAG: oligosaccharide flippase family protein [Mucilaginibacter sp.]
MTKNKLFIKLFSSGLQALSVQVLGSIFFYIVSVYISKDDFGIISWTNAVSIFITTILGVGLEQVVIRRIAASQRSDWAAAAYFTHSFIGFGATFVFLLLVEKITGSKSELYNNLPWFFLAQGLIFTALPLKQFLNAKERFAPYGVISVISNIGKIAAALLLVKNGQLYLNTVLIILICTSAIELISLLVFVLTKTCFSFSFRFSAYARLVKESLAQYIAVIFDISLSRMDWILLGIMATGSVLADYSFAYRAYELARLPMLIIAPIILPRFSRLLSINNKVDIEYEIYIQSFNRSEQFLAAGIPLVLNIIWSPLLQIITKGKYGESNSAEFLILSVCIPLQFFINFLWSLAFGAKKYKSVSLITVACAVTNIFLNVALIPKFGGAGAATAFFATTILQAGLYFRLVRNEIIKLSLLPNVLFIAEAALCYLLTSMLHIHFLLQLTAAVALYLLIAVFTGLISKQHVRNFKYLLAE